MSSSGHEPGCLAGVNEAWACTCPKPPADVLDWLDETYTAEGIDIWLRNWREADDQRRDFLTRLARTPDMGT